MNLRAFVVFLPILVAISWALVHIIFLGLHQLLRDAEF